jgi:hypothetical protein
MKISFLRLFVGLTLIVLGLATLTSLRAAAVITVAENANDYNSSLKNTSAFNFDNLKLGVNKNVTWTGVGTFDQLNVLKTDQYGGAPDAAFSKGSPYSVQGVGSSVKATTLTLNKASSYFGFWWSAGDASNQLQFFNGKNLVAEFTTKTLMANLPKDYYGNPMNRSLNHGEPYAFINFFGDGSMKWDRIVFTNVTSSGFESDNYTSRVQTWTPKTDGKLPGRAVAMVTGTKVTALSSLPSSWKSGPGAPLPPFSAFLVLAGLLLFRRSKVAAV